MKHKIVEIKANCSNPKQAMTYLKRQKAKYIGIDHQIDTYFRVESGRLKLREGTIEKALIHYQRSNQAEPKLSNVLLYQPTVSTDSLKAILTTALGILAIVDKKRHIYFIDNVKFHIDEVKNLGSFIEIEAISENEDWKEEKLLEQCKHYMNELSIQQEDLVQVSYSDLIINARSCSEKG